MEPKKSVKKPIAAVVQMSSSHVVSDNLNKVTRFVQEAKQQNADIVFLPENFYLMGKNETDKLQYAEEYGYGDIQNHISALAKEQSVWIIGGTMPIRALYDTKKIYGASIVWDAQGEYQACYHKMHLFDVKLPGARGAYLESETVQAGNELVALPTPIGQLGLTVCYDVRFPELYQQLVTRFNVDCFSVASAFTKVTGKAHWEVLCRARAIENGAFVLASNQIGTHPNGRETYGHSMIISPWGDILASLQDEEGVIAAEIDLEAVQMMRQQIPVHKHRKIH